MAKGGNVWELRGCRSRYLPDLILGANQAILDSGAKRSIFSHNLLQGDRVKST